MKLQARIGDDLCEIEVTREGRRVVANIDGRDHDLTVSEPEPNVFLFKNKGKITEVYVNPGTSIGEIQTVLVKGKRVEFHLIDPKRLRGSLSGDTEMHGIAEIRSAMPGKVVRILCLPGANVSKGDGIVVVEAMKMQNELKAPQNGTVKNIAVAEGETVSAGQILATLE